MADNIDQIVAKAVTKVLEQHFPRLREELIQRVADEVKPALGSGALSGGASAEELLRRREVHRKKFCGRCWKRRRVLPDARHCSW